MVILMMSAYVMELLSQYREALYIHQTIEIIESILINDDYLELH